MAARPPVLFFGSAVFGSVNIPTLQDPANVTEFLDTVKSAGISQIDTAGRYPHDNPGGSERMLGEVGAAAKGFTINTKVVFVGASTAGSLSLKGVRESVAKSKKHTEVDKVGILYAHLVDPETPLEEQAEALNEQYQNGFCERIGVCNFPPEILDRLIKICEEKGYAKPSVYQGQYNLVCREHEATLIPLLRKHNMTFVAYSPLGGGFLTGNLTQGKAEGTRLESAYGAHFRAWYDRPQLHDAIRRLLEVIQPLDIAPTEAALRWLAYHSLLGEKDGIILGATKKHQIPQNVADIKKGPLPEDVLKQITLIKEIIESGDLDFTVDAAKMPKS